MPEHRKHFFALLRTIDNDRIPHLQNIISVRNDNTSFALYHNDQFILSGLDLTQFLSDVFMSFLQLLFDQPDSGHVLRCKRT